jgi:peptidoglycan/LPS O-acetylase OafA/YrhL
MEPDGAPCRVGDLFLRVIAADVALGANFFMLLSGFFAYGSLMRGKKSFGKFLHQRAWRLYPLYLIMVLVYIAGSWVFPNMSKLPANPYDAAIFLLQTLVFLPGLWHVRPLMDVAWTLSFIVLFYFIEGALAHFFRISGLSRWSRIGILTGGGLLWALVGDSLGCWEARTAIFWVGMALSEAVGGLQRGRRTWATNLVAWAAAIAILGVWLRTDLMLSKPTGIVSVPLLRLVLTTVTLSAFLWVAFFGPQWWKRLLSGRRLGQLGAASYSFYLTHGFAIKAFHYGIIPWLGSAASEPLVFWASQFVGLALSIGIARLTYVLIERPISELAPESDRTTAPDLQNLIGDQVQG